MHNLATIKLIQQGKNGRVTTMVDFGEQGQNLDSASHTAMAHLASHWMQAEPEVIRAVVNEPGAPEYTSSFSLWEEDNGESVYAKLNMEPKLDTKEAAPSSYEAICYLSSIYLMMCGIINEDGDVLDQDALVDNVELAVTGNSRVH